jgi:hypothetical protein
MPIELERYRLGDGDLAAPETFNRVFQALDLRLARLEGLRIDWRTAVAELVQIGLVRIDRVLVRAFEAVGQLNDLGVGTMSATEATVPLGPLALTVAEADRGRFTPARSGSVIPAAVGDGSVGMLARVTGYDRATGLLPLTVVYVYGAGTYADRQIRGSGVLNRTPAPGGVSVDGDDPEAGTLADKLAVGAGIALAPVGAAPDRRLEVAMAAEVLTTLAGLADTVAGLGAFAFEDKVSNALIDNSAVFNRKLATMDQGLLEGHAAGAGTGNRPRIGLRGAAATVPPTRPRSVAVRSAGEPHLHSHGLRRSEKTCSFRHEKPAFGGTGGRTIGKSGRAISSGIQAFRRRSSIVVCSCLDNARSSQTIQAQLRS